MLNAKQLLKNKNSIEDANVGPQILTLRLTPFCNLNCKYCMGGSISDGNFYSNRMDLFQLLDLFKQASDMGISEIDLNLLNGEPFVSNDIKTVIKEVKQMGFRGVFTTNGSLLDDEVSDIMNTYKWDLLTISIDSIDPNVQYLLRPAMNNVPYLNNIFNFIRGLEKDKSGINIELNVVVSKINFRNIPDLINFFGKYSIIKKINLLKLIVNPSLSKDLWKGLALNKDDEADFIDTVRNFKNNLLIRGCEQWVKVEENKIDNVAVNSRCFLNYFMIAIDYDGSIIQCPQIGTSVGSNVKEATLRDIWLGSHFLLRKRLAQNAECSNSCCTPLKNINNCIINFLSKRS